MRLLGSRESDLHVRSQEIVSQSINSYRDIYIKDRRGFYSETFSKGRFELSRIFAKVNYIGVLNKYIIYMEQCKINIISYHFLRNIYLFLINYVQ